MKIKKVSLIAFAAISMLSLASCKLNTGGSSSGNTSTSSQTTTPVNSSNSATSAASSTLVPSSSATSTPTSTSSSSASSTSNATSTPSSATSTPTSKPTSTPTSTPTSVPSTSTSTSTPTSSTTEKDPESPSGGGNVGTETTVKFTSVLGEYESAYVEFNSVDNATGYNFYLTGGQFKTRTLVDSSVVYCRNIGNKLVRADFIGLEASKYTLEVKPVINNIEDKNTGSTAKLDVVAYDRSGYAHFKYSEGVGAYNSDGTLKNNAIILYVTDETKNTVTLNYGGKTVTGIGNILNSVGQASTDVGHLDQCKKVDQGKSYYAKANTNQGILKDLAEANIPLVIRFVGCVSDSGLYKQGTFDASKGSLIEGLTAYANNDTVNSDGTKTSANNKLADYGGTLGDNGHMARMKSAKNLTLEGIGDDAIIDGWGFHLICEAGSPELAKNFEVRNLTFMNTPEDAIGMEGQQETSTKTITASVERCWVHHNTFLAPSIANAAESDKSEGDGSCDFKRGQYFTCSYNYFEGCHKTNLIGSSDSSLQYNLTYHHNIWYNCGSRVPLLRQANVHFYNNYILGGDNASYVSDIRADGYLFAEGNYYQGAKNIIDSVGSGCAVKMYNNVMLASFSKFNVDSVITNDRESKVTCNTQYKDISYANFDTNPNLFYYDSVNKKSDCYLTSATEARKICLQQSGSKYRTNAKKTQITNDYKLSYVDVSNSIDLSNPYVISYPTSKSDGLYNGIYYSGISGITSSSVKFKGAGMTFKLDSAAILTISMTSSSGAYKDGYVVNNETGEVVLSGSGSVVLKPGVYVVLSSIYIEGTGSNTKETTVNEFTLTKYNSEEFNKELLDNYALACSKLPSVITYTGDCLSLIKAAINAYNNIPADVRDQVTTPYSTVEAKYNEYLSLGKAYVEGLISDIGAVTNESGSKITKARTEYDALLAIADVEISNYNVLVEAENNFKTYAVDACIKAINEIGDVTLDSKALIENARNAYNQLNDSDKALVTNYNTLVVKEEAYNNLVSVNNVITLINNGANTLEGYNNIYTEYNKLSDTLKSQVTNKAKYEELMVEYTNLLISSLPEASNVTTSNQGTITLAKNLYNSLENKTGITNYPKLVDCDSKLTELLNQRQVLTFNTGASGDNSYFTVSGKLQGKPQKVTYDGVDYTTALKMESSTYITFKTTGKCKVTLVLSIPGTIKIDGKTYTSDDNGVVIVELEAGEHKVTKDKSLDLYALIVE